jgi:DNA repair protein RadA/Sms
MPKPKTRYVCQVCGSAQPKWQGKCPDCGEWNTLVETVVQEPAAGRLTAFPSATPTAAQPLSDIPADGYERIPVPIGELSRVLGGGIVPGSVVLISGDPGIGKSTLLIQLCAVLAERDGPVLYVSGEESAAQIKLRAGRLGITTPNVLVLADTHLESISAHIEKVQPRLVVVDSVQSIYSDSLPSGAGSVTQVRDCSAYLLRLAKSQTFPLFLVGHVTKEGAIAGPRVLEHMVDTVLYLEGERFHSFRLLRAAKNRFGSTNEIGVRGVPGRTAAQRGRLGHRGHHGGQPTDPGGGPGAHQRHQLRPAATHRQRRGLQPAVADHGCAEQARAGPPG